MFSDMCCPALTYLALSVTMIILTVLITLVIFIKISIKKFSIYLIFFIWIAIWCFQVYIYCKILTLLCMNDLGGLAWLLWLGLPLLNFAIISLQFLFTESSFLNSALTKETEPLVKTLYYT